MLITTPLNRERQDGRHSQQNDGVCYEGEHEREPGVHAGCSENAGGATLKEHARICPLLTGLSQVERQIHMQMQMRERMMAQQLAMARERLYWWGAFYALAFVGLTRGYGLDDVIGT